MFVLLAEERLADGIRRIITEQTDQIIELLSSEGTHEAIHEARKAHKRIRAVLRLVRLSIGEARFAEENIFYRNSARKLSNIRDATALIETLESLQHYYSADLTNLALEPVFTQLEIRRSMLEEQFQTSEALMKEVKDAMVDFREQSINLPISGDSFFLVIGGMRDVYKNGYKLYAKSFRKPKMKNLHDWRKEVKYLWYQILLLQGIWPELMKPLAAELKKLSDQLGLWRDLGLLRVALESSSTLCEDETLRTQLIHFSATYQQALLDVSLPLGQRLYRERPRPFAFRMQGYYKSWKPKEHMLNPLDKDRFGE